MNYARFINEVGSSRKGSLIREMTKRIAHAEPGSLIAMAGGLPNPELFPFQSMTFQVDANTKLNISGRPLLNALQYQPTAGYPPLLETLKKMQLHFHKPPNWDNSEIIVTVGSQQGLSSILEMTLTKGDAIIVPDPIYSSALQIMDPLAPRYLAIPSDGHGMLPHHLRTVLETCAAAGVESEMPRILYVNPTGANPNGVNLSDDRKKEIYKIAQEYNLLILEDDPYYYLHFEEKHPVSFLSLDVDGRVLRFDSFSKILSSGVRIGFTTGPKELLKTLELSMQASVLHAASLSQVVVDGVLREWGIEGFEAHTKKVQAFYKARRDVMLDAAKKHLTGLAEWHVPGGGMFLWIKVLGVKDTFEMVTKDGIQAGILLLPGREFCPDRSAPSAYLRASFSIVELPDIHKGMERLAKLIRTEQTRQ